jgi:hypothetical protein
MVPDVLLSAVMCAPVFAGVALALWAPKNKSAKWAWFGLFLVLGAMTYFAQAEKGRRKDAVAIKSRSELLEKIGGLQDQNSKLLVNLEKARRENAALKERIEAELPNPRRLSKEQAETLVAALRSHTFTVVIRHANTVESQDYARQLSDALTKAGWILGFARFAGRQADATGVNVVTQNAGGLSSPGAIALVRALRRAGIAVTTRVEEEIIEPLTLYVGIQSARAKNANVPPVPQ